MSHFHLLFFRTGFLTNSRILGYGRPAGLRHNLRGWPPDVHFQKRLHLRGLSRINATLPIIGFYAGDREHVLLVDLYDGFAF